MKFRHLCMLLGVWGGIIVIPFTVTAQQEYRSEPLAIGFTAILPLEVDNNDVELFLAHNEHVAVSFYPYAYDGITVDNLAEAVTVWCEAIEYHTRGDAQPGNFSDFVGYYVDGSTADGGVILMILMETESLTDMWGVMLRYQEGYKEEAAGIAHSFFRL